MPLSLHHIHIRSKDKHKLAQWYCDQLEFKLIGDIERKGEPGGPNYITSDDGRTGITIFTSEKPPNNVFPAFGSNADRFIAIWNRMGSPRVFNHYYFYSFYFNDLDGNQLEVCCTDVPAIEARLKKEGIESFKMTPETYTPST